MGTSQAPVREALRELSTLGIVEYSKNRGTRVRVPDNQELCEIYDVRAEIEGYAASLAARHFAANTEALAVHVEEMSRLPPATIFLALRMRTACFTAPSFPLRATRRFSKSGTSLMCGPGRP